MLGCGRFSTQRAKKNDAATKRLGHSWGGVSTKKYACIE